MADFANLIVEVDSKGVPVAVKELNRLTGTSKKTETATSRLTEAWRKYGSLFTVGIVAVAFRNMIKAVNSGQRALAQLEAGLKSTGGTSGQTMKSMVDLGEQLQQTTVYADDLVQSVEAILLSFTNITDDVFPRTMQAAADVATRMGIDLRSAAIQLAKALNDPIQNLGALSRSGIQFSKDQKILIKSLWEAGQQADAQNIILKELEVQYGGSARAARDTLGGAMTALQNNVGDLAESVGLALSPALISVISLFSEAAAGAAKFVSAITMGAEFIKLVDNLYRLEEAGEGVAAMHQRLAAAQRRQERAAAKAAAALALRVAAAEMSREISEKRQEAIGKVISALEHETVMMRKSAAAQAAYNVFLAGGGKEAMEYARRLAEMQEGFAQQQGIKSWIKSLKMEREQLGMNAGDKAFYTAITDGATRTQAKEIATMVDATAARRKMTTANSNARAVLQSLVTEEERIFAQIDLLGGAYQRGTITTDEYGRAVARLTENLDKLQDQTDSSKDANEKFTRTFPTLAGEMQSLTREFGTTFIDTLFDAERRAELTFESVATDFAKMVARMMAQQALLRALGLPSMFTPQATPTARGAAFVGGRVAPMARGGVVTEPTLFPMQRGAGLMGEAGPEAVMPLTRTSSGELGVKAEGAGAEVNVNIINNTGARVTQRRRQSGRGVEVDVMIGESVDRQVKDGRFDRSMRSAFGLTRRGGR